MSAAVPFWRFLPNGATPDENDLRRAHAEGKGAFARTLREARALIGVHRTAALLRRMPADPGPSCALVLASGFQPRSIEDALQVSFAIAGLSLRLRTIDGLASLANALNDPTGSDLADADMILLPLLPGSDVSRERARELAVALRARGPSSVLVVSLEDGEGAATATGDDWVLRLSGPVADERFAATFGAIPTSEAAEVLADRVAARAARLRGLLPKLLVTDLDGTLWSGTLGETGIGALHASYADALARLSKRGIVLALASRNAPGDVEAAFASHPEWPLRYDASSAAAIGWEAKDALVARVLDTLSLAPEHMVFVDDDPANCARVAARFPEADVRHFASDAEAFAATLAADPLLLDAGDERSGNRSELYRRRAEVERVRTEAPDMNAFLKELDTRLTMVPLSEALFPRAVELALRVNQFAMNDRRPTVEELARRRSPLDFMVRLDDAFGSHGLVGLALGRIEAETAVVESLFLSCRALGREVEGAMLHALAERARREGCAVMTGKIERLPRNEPVRRYLSVFEPDDAGNWRVRLDGGQPEKPEGVALRWEATI